MRTTILILIVSVFIDSCEERQRTFESYDAYPDYTRNDLGLTYNPKSSTFKVWSPVAKNVVLHLYESGHGDDRIETLDLFMGKEGAWEITINRNLQGLFYTFQIETDSGILDETPGIYAKASGVNGKRAAVLDMNLTNPDGWENDKRPPLTSISQAVIYELHIRDFTIHPSSGSLNGGKYLGFTELGTKNTAGQTTGIDHLVELGVTHVHLLPVFDFRSIDETKLDSPQFNWGYDPQNYNVPDGSYSTDPYNPTTRIKEFKQMVQALHNAGIRVVMDVVYNHTGETEKSNFNLEVPGYYYRHTAEGKWSDAAACGNETASERYMMRKYIMESCAWWVKEYHIDGFRVDLMGIHDIETMNQLSTQLLRLEPSLLFYGEGWTAGKSPLPDSLRALKANTARLKHFAAFSDDLRDGLKGSVFDEGATGLVNGGAGAEQSIRFGVVGATSHPQVDYAKVNYSKAPWAREPWQCINYVSCHDNHTLADKLRISGKGNFSQAQLESMDKLANGIVLTSQGIPFLHAGEEMMRTKKGIENSFNRPDSINSIDWNWKTKYAGVYAHYRQLIAMRKEHPALRLPSTKNIQENLSFLDTGSNVIAYLVDGTKFYDNWGKVVVIINGNSNAINQKLPPGKWAVGYDGSLPAGAPSKNVADMIRVEPLSLMVLGER